MQLHCPHVTQVSGECSLLNDSPFKTSQESEKRYQIGITFDTELGLSSQGWANININLTKYPQNKKNLWSKNLPKPTCWVQFPYFQFVQQEN